MSRYCIVGGGYSGIATARALLKRGLAFELLEREDDFGGIWYAGSGAGKVYDSTFTITSRANTELGDAPLPSRAQRYLHHTQLLEYLRELARTDGLERHARFGVEVTRVAPTPEGEWTVVTNDGREQRYRGVIVANGVFAEPVRPELPGTFEGEAIHAADYRGAHVFDGKRALIIGAGNSGCDIAADAAQRATRTFISMRRGRYFLPKIVAGLAVQDWIASLKRQNPETAWQRIGETLRTMGHDATAYGLPAPPAPLSRSRAVINSLLLYYLAHGRVEAVPPVTRLMPRGVELADGRHEAVDIIVHATGYRPSFPFLSEALDPLRGARHELQLNLFHRRHERLLFVGYFVGPTGMGRLLTVTTEVAAAYLAHLDGGDNRARAVRAVVEGPQVPIHNPDLEHNDRNRFEMDVDAYLARMSELARLLGVSV